MANSRKPGPLSGDIRFGRLGARTPGVLGLWDQGDPSVTTLMGDSPGPLGLNDWATPGFPRADWLSVPHLGAVCRADDGSALILGTRDPAALPATPPKPDTELPWNDVAADFERWEGKVAHMYLDTAGLVTVGVGKMLPNVKAAQALGFIKQADGLAASAEDIATDFKQVSKQAKGKLASSYKRYTKLMLPDEIIDTLLKKLVAGFEADLKENFAHYRSYPAPAKRALLDMVYNLGLAGLVKFKKLKKAAESGKWRTAAVNCERAGPSDERNDWTRDMFLQAAAEAEKK